MTRRARRVVVDIFAALGHRAENAVLIGGAVPGLIEERSLRNAPGHAGTTDVDILLDPMVFSIKEYETFAERLMERGYRYRLDRDGNELKFSLEVDVDGHSVAVDFLAPPVPGKSGFRVPIQAGLHAHALSGGQVGERRLGRGDRVICQLRFPQCESQLTGLWRVTGQRPSLETDRPTW